MNYRQIDVLIICVAWAIAQSCTLRFAIASTYYDANVYPINTEFKFLQDTGVTTICSYYQKAGAAHGLG